MNTSFFGELLQTISDRGRALLDARAARARSRSAPKAWSSCARIFCPAAARPRAWRWRAKSSPLRRIDAPGRASPSSRRWRQRFGPDRARMEHAVAAWREAPSDATAAEVHAAAEPRRQELFRRLNLAPGGTAALVRMREQLIDALDHRDDLARGRRGFRASVLVLVQPRLPGAAPHRLVDAGDRAGKDHPLRGGARDPRLGRPAPRASIRPTGAATPSSIRRWSTSR